MKDSKLVYAILMKDSKLVDAVILWLFGSSGELPTASQLAKRTHRSKNISPAGWI